MHQTDKIDRRDVLRLSAGAVGAALTSKLAWAQGRPPVSNAETLRGFSALQKTHILSQYGKSLKIRDYLGKPLIINFWSHWCGHCIAEFRDMHTIQNAIGGPDAFPILLVSQPVDWDIDQGFAAQQRISFPLFHIAPPSNAQESENISHMMLDYVPSGRVITRHALPLSYLVARSGTLVSANLGDADWASKDTVPQILRALEGNIGHSV